MKKLKTRHPALLLLVACYAAGLVALWAVQGWGLVQNRLATARGDLSFALLALDDFELVQLEPQPDGTLRTTGDDPQLLLRDTSRRVDSVSLSAQFSHDPIMVTAYWARPGQDYSDRRMAYSTASKEGGYGFVLPAAGGQSLRLDMGSQAGNTVSVGPIAINQKRLALSFFIPTATQLVLLAVVPGFAACGLWIVAPLLPKPRRKPAAKAGDTHG